MSTPTSFVEEEPGAKQAQSEVGKVTSILRLVLYNNDPSGSHYRVVPIAAVLPEKLRTYDSNLCLKCVV